MNLHVIEQIDILCAGTVKEINRSSIKGRVKHQPLSDLFLAVNSGKKFKSELNVVELATRGDTKSRKALKELIFNYLVSIVKPKESIVDKMLSGYYINYYGTVDDLTSSSDIRVFTDFINKILIPKNSDLETKYWKLAQICFQEIYGLGPLDEFLNFKPDSKFNKIEELAMAGPNQLSLKISGVNVKLDKLNYDSDKIVRITRRLDKLSEHNLNRLNPVVETELLDGSRINLTSNPFTKEQTFNIRLHYGNEITRAKMIEIGSSTWELEGFKDKAMSFRPRILVVGPQGVGKSTIIRDIARRFPRNSVIVTAENAFELDLKSISKLTVIETRLDALSVEDFLKAMFRFNATCLVLGEARTPEDVMIYTQMAQRQDFGTISTWHSASALTAIMGMSKALFRGGYATSEIEALKEVTDSVDLVIRLGVCDEKHGERTGLRHNVEVCEVPKISKNFDGDYKLNTLFEYDYEDYKLKKVNLISEELQEIFLKRAYLPEEMESLKNGKYF